MQWLQGQTQRGCLRGLLSDVVTLGTGRWDCRTRTLFLVMGTQTHVHTHTDASVLAQVLLTRPPQKNLKEQVKRGFGKAAGRLWG